MIFFMKYAQYNTLSDVILLYLLLELYISSIVHCIYYVTDKLCLWIVAGVPCLLYTYTQYQA